MDSPTTRWRHLRGWKGVRPRETGSCRSRCRIGGNSRPTEPLATGSWTGVGQKNIVRSVRKNKIMPKKYWCPEKEHLPSTTLTQCHWFRSLLLHHPRCFHATKTANRRPFLGSSPTPPNPQTHNAFPRRQCTGFSSISAKGGALHRRRCGSNGNCQSGQKWAKVGKSGHNSISRMVVLMNNSIDDTILLWKEDQNLCVTNVERGQRGEQQY